MLLVTWVGRRIGFTVVLLSVLAAGGCASAGSGGAGLGSPPGADGVDNENVAESDDDTELPFIARNDGGGDLAARMGGATFTGQAVGPLASGTLTLIFDADGVLTSLGGTLLGSFFRFPEQTEVVFDYLGESVTGTYVEAGAEPRTLEAALAESGHRLEWRQIAVNLTGDTFTARTVYLAELPGQPGDGAITVAATLRFATNDVLEGTVEFPGYRDEQEPVVTLERL